MAALLFASELGEGLGHLNRLIAVARHLGAHELTFAASGDLQRNALRGVLGSSVRVLGNPMLAPVPAPAGAPMPDLSLADTLCRIGFADRTAVAGAVDAWARLVDEVRPDVIVSDYAPTLRVAVATRVPQVVVGSGFTITPRVSPLPAYESTSPLDERSRAAEAAVLTCFNAVRRARGMASFDCLAEALQGDATFVASYPFFDPYRALRVTAALQPFNLPPILPGPPAAARVGPAVFAYLDANYPGVNVVLDALNRMGRQAEVFIRHAAPAEVARNCFPHVGVHAAPADFARLLPQTRLLVHHGGLATGAAGLLGGVPQLVLPRHTEQLLNARGLDTLGTSVGLGLAAKADADGLRRIMLRLLDEPDVTERAGAVARDLQATRISGSERPVVEAVAAMIPAARPATRGPTRSPEARMAAVMAAANDRAAGRTRRSYLICSSPRVGSNMLCDALSALEGGGRPFEYFNERATSAYLERIGARSLSAADYLDYLFSRRMDDTGTFGIKVQYHQLLSMLPSPEDRHAFVRRFDAVLFLRRRNKLRQAISETRARASSIWYAEDASHADQARRGATVYDRAAIAKYLAYVIADDSGWESLLEGARIPHAVMIYEDMILDFQKALSDVSECLGLGLVLAGDAAPSTHRFGDDLNDSWEAQFREDLSGEGILECGNGSTVRLVHRPA